MVHFVRASTRVSSQIIIQLDDETNERLRIVAEQSNRSASTLAAEAISAYIEAEEWQIREIQGGLQDVDEGRVVTHGRVEQWLRSWGKKTEEPAPE
jgi:RHH-type transcriptional regulator, rel operon repressor / antitoxin RelB